MIKYKLYWIKNPDHADPFTEGYIGITKRSTDHRLNEHAKRREDLDLSNASIEILHIGSKDDVSKLEQKYRPESWIGWNKAKGGLTGGRPTGIHTSGWTHSDESKKIRSENLKGDKNPQYGKSTSDNQKRAVGESAKIRFTGQKKNYKVITPIMKGKDNPRAKSVMIDGTTYSTINEASKILGIHHTTIGHRCRNTDSKYDNYSYV